MSEWASPPDTPAHIARLFDILRLIVHRPGIGFDDVRKGLGRTWAEQTLHKDLKILKTMGLLDDRKHRDGYFVSATSFSIDETQQLMQSLRSLAKNLRHPHARSLFEKLTKRLGPIAEEDGSWGYPLMALGDRVIVETLDDDLEEIVSELANCMLTGRSVEVETRPSPWGTKPARLPLYPLQFRFYRVAWYLVAELFDGRFVALRLDRLERHMQYADLPKRRLADQLKALERVRERTKYGWGIQIPPDVQHLVEVTVRFMPDKAGFIEEAVRRHPTQETERLDDGSILYRVTLHEQALTHFADWVLGYGDRVEALAPASLRQMILAKIHGYGELYPELLAPQPQ